MTFKARVDSVFEIFEYAACIITGILLITTVLFLISDMVKIIFTLPAAVGLFFRMVKILDRTLLILMITGILYTVRLSVKSHTLYTEPFLIFGLIAAIRRILVISVETAYQPAKFQPFMIGISMMGIMTFPFSLSLIHLSNTFHRNPRRI